MKPDAAGYCWAMPLLFVDLDNTISDRAASLRRWAVEYLTARFGEATDEMVAAMIVADGDGLTSKIEAAAAYAEVLGLSDDEQAEIITVMRAGTLEQLAPTPGNIEALDRASAAGFTPFIVTNGRVSQQEGKVAKLGLAGHVAGMVVSEGVGIAKPDPEIFRIAASRAGQTLAGAWMIGDSAESDIEGAAAAGLDSVWLRRGRSYPAGVTRPTLMADSFSQAVDQVLAYGDD